MPMHEMSPAAMRNKEREHAILQSAADNHYAEMVACANHVQGNAHLPDGCPVCRAALAAIAIATELAGGVVND